MAGRQLGIAVELFFQPGKAAQLRLTRPYDALADLRRAFWNGRGAHFFVIHCWHINVNIDAVEQRPGNLRDVPLDNRRCAVALASSVIEISARLRVLSLLNGL